MKTTTNSVTHKQLWLCEISRVGTALVSQTQHHKMQQLITNLKHII